MLDVRRLRLLRELRLRGTVAAVAEALSFTPSAVSQQLAQLERDVGVPLLHRQGRRLVLTERAIALADRTEDILDLLERAQREAQSPTADASGTVRIATFQSAALSLLPPALDLLGVVHPRLRIEMVQHEPESALWRTFVGDFDLVIAEEYPDHAAPRHRGLDRVVLGDDALRFAVPLTATDIRSLADSGERAWVVEPAGAASRHWCEQRCRSAGVEPDVRFETADLRAQLRLIESGHAVGFLNDLTWRAEGPAPRVRFIESPDAPRRRIFSAARLARATSPEIVAVREALALVAADRLTCAAPAVPG